MFAATVTSMATYHMDNNYYYSFMSFFSECCTQSEDGLLQKEDSRTEEQLSCTSHDNALTTNLMHTQQPKVTYKNSMKLRYNTQKHHLFDM